MTTLDWILVADRSRARILKTPKDKDNHYSVEASFEHPEGRLHRQDMESDEPGRISLPGTNRTFPEPHEDPEHRESRKFAATLCDYLDRANSTNQFDRLIVIAPPAFLGVLREHLTSRLKSRVAFEIHKELMQLSDSQIQGRVGEILEANAV